MPCNCGFIAPAKLIADKEVGGEHIPPFPPRPSGPRPPSSSSGPRPYSGGSRPGGFRPFNQSNGGFRINGQIRGVNTVRLIMPDGTNRGVVDLMEAQQMARNMNLDLIEVAATNDPPVCRIFDFGKFNFEREKKEREAKRTQKSIEIKGIRLRPKTSEHHLYFKVRAARRFLEAGNKVQVTERFKGREDRIQHVALAMMGKVREGCLDLAVVEVQPRMEGRTMLMILVPNAATLLAAKNRGTQERLEQEKAEDEAKGYNEEDEEHDDDDENENDEVELNGQIDAPSDKPEDRVQAAQATVAADALPAIDFSDKEARRKFNKSKRDRNRDMEQFGLP